MGWFDSASNYAEELTGFVPNGPAAPVVTEEPADGSSLYVGPGGGPPEAAASAFSHYMEEVEELGELEKAPDEPAERPELSPDEMDAKADAMSDALARPEAGEVTSVVKTLGGMNDSQRKEAIGNMSDAEFDAMMENLPPEEQERLGPLAAATDDPKRKLRLWGAGEKAELGRDERNLRDVPTSEEAMEDAAVIDHAINAAKDGQTEVQDEVDTTLKQLEESNLSPADQKKLVDDMIRRKEKERAIEKQFNVNLTNDKGGETSDGMPTPRAVWSEKELAQMEVVLDRLPDDAIQENPDLAAIHRAKKDYDKDDDGNWVESDTTTGNTEHGVIEITDSAMENDEDHSGDSSEIAGIHKITELQQTLAHEVGHVMDARNPSDARAVTKHATTKQKFDPTLVPKGGAHTKGNEGGDDDTWDYARSGKSDYFAEMYSKAIVAPELLYQDLVEGPQNHLDKLINDGAPKDEIAEARRAADAMEAQHASMRKQVFHIDPKEDKERVKAMEARADELGLDDDAKNQLLADYKKQRAQAMTPEQLDIVDSTYDDRIYEY